MPRSGAQRALAPPAVRSCDPRLRPRHKPLRRLRGQLSAVQPWRVGYCRSQSIAACPVCLPRVPAPRFPAGSQRWPAPRFSAVACPALFSGGLPRAFQRGLSGALPLILPPPAPCFLAGSAFILMFSHVLRHRTQIPCFCSNYPLAWRHACLLPRRCPPPASSTSRPRIFRGPWSPARCPRLTSRACLGKFSDFRLPAP
jgi:hypothetical protein